MAEFKINKALSKEISGLRNSANSINKGYSAVPSEGVSSLKTSASIIAQHKSIKTLLDLYKSLALRDAKDLDSLVAEVEKMDAAISSSHNT